MSRARSRGISAWLKPALVIAAAGLGLGLSAEAAAGAPGSPPANLTEAQARLAKAPSPAEYAADLESFSTQLPPSDSLALIDGSLASVAPASLRALTLKAGDLALLLGIFDEAARHYAEAAALPETIPGGTRASPGSDREHLLLRAARCDLAAGDSDKALELSSTILLGTKDPELSAESRLVGAWALAIQGRSAEARSIALPLAAASLPSNSRREAEFLVWLCTEGQASSPDKAKAAASLAADFPGSPEALIASGTASAPPLPHWYLGVLSLSSKDGARVPADSTPPAASSSPPSQAAGQTVGQTAAPSVRGKRLQVGYFSVEANAAALKAELASKGFSAEVETITRGAATGGSSGGDERKRWIVVVAAGKDIARTMQALKEAGYEPYISE